MGKQASSVLHAAICSFFLITAPALASSTADRTVSGDPEREHLRECEKHEESEHARATGDRRDGDGCGGSDTQDRHANSGKSKEHHHDCDKDDDSEKEGNRAKDRKRCKAEAHASNEAPSCAAAVPAPSNLWPPNHKFAAIEIAGVTDPDGDPLDIQVLCIMQDEPLNAAGDGNTEYDAIGTGTPTAKLRAERSGTGDGRVYHVDFLATDPQGASCTGEVTVGVPHDRKTLAIDGGRLYISVSDPVLCGGQPPAPAATIEAPADVVAEATGQLTAVNIGLAQAFDGDGTPLPVQASNYGPFPLGVTVVIWSATDSTGVTISKQQTVTIKDTTPPVITAIGPDPVATYCEFSFILDGGASGYDVVDGDLSGSIVYGTVGSPWDGQFQATYTVQDSSGNSATATRTIVTPCDYDLYRNAPKFLTASGEYLREFIAIEAVGPITPLGPIETPLVYDSAGNQLAVSVTLEPEEWGSIVFTPIPIPTEVPVGYYGIGWSAIDSNGIMGQVLQVYAVVDTTPPMLTLNGATNVSLFVGDVYAEPGATANDIVDGDLSASIVTTGAVDTARAGIYVLTYRVTDSHYNSIQLKRTVAVNSRQDTVPPVVTAPPAVTVEATALMTPVPIGAGTAVDTVDGTVTVSPDNTGPFPLGTTEVTWTAQDSAGNIGTAVQQVTVVDTTAPVISAPGGLTAYASGDTSLFIGSATAADIFSVSLTNNAPSVFSIGDTLVTWIARDTSGNQATAVQKITVVLNHEPVANAGADRIIEHGDIVYLDASASSDPDGTVAGYAWFLDGTLLSEDTTFSKSDFDAGVHTLTLTVTDDHGATGSDTVVIDVRHPMSACAVEQLEDDLLFRDRFPDDNIGWASADFSDVDEIEKTFNHARYIDSSINQYLSLPEQPVWDAMDVQAKALYLINSERIGRGLKPYEGVSPNVVAVAQRYADYLREHNEVITHFRSSDGASPEMRLYEDPLIRDNRDQPIYPESLYANERRSVTPSEAVVEAIYVWIYHDKDPLSGPPWGHRTHVLQAGLYENSGTGTGEGLIGIGVSVGPYSAFSGAAGSEGSVVVLNSFDPSDTWDHTTTLTTSVEGSLQCNADLQIDLPPDDGSVVALERLEIRQSSLILTEGATGRIDVVGSYSDGSQNDVSHLVAYQPDLYSVVAISGGFVTGLHAGTVGVTVTMDGVVSNRLLITVGKPVDASNLDGTFGGEYAALIPGNASIENYDPRLFSLLTGLVKDGYGNPLDGVVIQILEHPEYGSVLTDSQGRFALPVEANTHTVTYAKYGYTNAHRRVSVGSNQWGVADDVILLDLDTKTTRIEVGAGVPQVHQSTPYTDVFGTRAATLVFDGISAARVVSPDGSVRQLRSFDVSATEFVTPESMPAILPETSSYTYCTELHVAGTGPGESVMFDNPVTIYVDNFLQFPVGEVVPVGYYDTLAGEWKALENGIVVELLDTNGDGKVDGIDYTGDLAPDDLDGDGAWSDEAAGIEDYRPGATYWRGQTLHFSAVDLNWWIGSLIFEPKKPDAESSKEDEKDKECKGINSYVKQKGQVFHEDIPIAGTDLTLHYSSQRTHGYVHKVRFDLSGESLPAGVVEMTARFQIGGRAFVQRFAPMPNQEVEFTWDGRDPFGNVVQGLVAGSISIGFSYDGEYFSNGNAATSGKALSAFPTAWAVQGSVSTGVAGREAVTVWTSSPITLYNAPDSEIANGWSISNNHVQASADRIYKGDGTVMDVHNPSLVLKTGATESLAAGDDGFYQKGGSTIDYEVDEAGVLHDRVTGLAWQNPLLPARFMTGAEASAYCESRIEGGYSDWRLPTKKEVDYTIHKGLVPPEFAIYQTDALNNWFVDALNPGHQPMAVICVHGEPLDQRYTVGLNRDAASGVVVDHENGLMWQDDATVTGGPMAWRDAIQHCEDLTLADFSDWRLPNINELLYTLPNDVFVNRFTFPWGQEPYSPYSSYARPFWSSTPNLRAQEYGWTVESEGFAWAFYRLEEQHYVRCVRDDLTFTRSPYRFDDHGRHQATVDLDTGAELVTFGYDASGRLATITDAFGNQVTIHRGADGKPTAIGSADGEMTYLLVDGSNDLVRVDYADGSAYRFSYIDSLMTEEIDPNGNRYTHQFDAEGRITQVGDPEGGLWSFFSRRDPWMKETEYGFTTAEGNSYLSLLSTLATGYERRFTVDTDGTPLEVVTDPATQDETYQSCGVTTAIDYIDDIKTKKPIPGTVTTAQPSGLTSVTQLTQAYGEGGADTSKRILTVTENGKTTTVLDDLKAGLKTTTSPEGRLNIVQYDPTTLKAQQVAVPGLLPVQYGYDARGRLTTATVGQRTTLRTYDDVQAKGRLASITDAEGKTTGYGYDERGRLARVTHPDGSVSDYSYDANGNMTKRVVPSRQAHGFTFNGVDEPTAESSPLGKTTAYSYDRDRQLTRITLPSGERIDYGYAGGKLATVTGPEGTTSYAYACGSQVSRISRNGEQLSYAYDGDLLTRVEAQGTSREAVTYGYNSDFNLTSLGYAGGTTAIAYDKDGLASLIGGYALTRNSQNGLLLGRSDGQQVTGYQYNGYGEVTRSETTVANQPVYANELSYGPTGKITGRQETLDGTSHSYAYSYDAKGRLTGVSRDGSPAESYTYDANGNRLLATSTTRGVTEQASSYNADDQLQASGDTQYEYDANGRLSRKVTPSGATAYTYASQGQLLAVQTPERLIEYVHGPTGQRLAKKVDGVIVEKYLWLDLTTLLAVYDGQDNLLQRFEYAGTRTPVRMRQGGQTYYIASDHLGSPKVITDASGNVVRVLDYDSFGNVVHDSNPDFRLPFGFAGGLRDGDTGLIRFGYRDYDPAQGRWTARDPIGFAGGDENLYAYVLGDPVVLIDPTGLADHVTMGGLNQSVYGYLPQAQILTGKVMYRIVLINCNGQYEPFVFELQSNNDTWSSGGEQIVDPEEALEEYLDEMPEKQFCS